MKSTWTDDCVDVYYPFWVQVLSLAGIPAMTIAAFWLLTRPLWEQGITTPQFLAGAAFGAAALYQCFIGWRALPYLRVRMTASRRGLDITSKDGRRLIAWSELAPPHDYSFATTTRLSLRSGEHILYAFDNMKNIEMVKNAIREEGEAPA